jgi:hypothetical protein
MTSLRNAALEYADRGWHVFPLMPRTKRPLPRTNGYLEATDDLAQTFLTWKRYPEANIGLACHQSDLVVLDVDPRHGGDDTLAEREKQWGALPATIEAETGGGGWHYFFPHCGGTLRGKLGAGLDVKDHGYVVAPPSLHPSGRPYVWGVDGHPDDVPLALLPDEWVDQLRIVVSSNKPPGVAASAGGASPDPLRRIPAADYVRKLTGREPDRHGYFQCPFHGGGNERTPSLKVKDVVWSCFACEPLLGKRCQGGNCYDLAALLWGFAAPPRGADYLEVKARLRGLFGV